MQTIETTFIKINDDETCALLKPFVPNAPPIVPLTNEIVKIFQQFPEVKRRVLAKVAISNE